MDKKGYSKGFIVFTYAFMTRCWRGKAGSGAAEMAVCAFVGVIRGVVMTLLEGRLPTYFARLVACFAAALFICLADRYLYRFPSGIFAAFTSMILPMAAGAMLADGIYGAKEEAGMGKIKNAFLISVTLAVGVAAAMALTWVRYV